MREGRRREGEGKEGREGREWQGMAGNSVSNSVAIYDIYWQYGNII